MAKTIGIDLGTTNSCMAVLEGGEPTVIPNAEGGRTTPSVVAFTKDGQRLVGAPARRQQVTNPQNTIFSIKRFMGRKFDEVSEEMTIVPYEVVKGPNGDVRVKAEGKEYAPPEISAMILQKLKADAEAYLGEPVDRRGHHRPGVLQQRAARGDEGRRQDRRPQRAPHHQRADRGRARVRARQGRHRPDDPRLRPRRRHVRRVGARARRRRLRGQVDRRRQPPRRRQLRQGDRRLDGRASSRSDQGIDLARRPDGAPAPLRGGGEGEDRAVVDDDDADQPAVRHRDAGRPEAPRPAAHAREARGDHRRPARADRRPDEAGAHRRRARRVEDRPRRPRRRHDAHAGGAGEGQGDRRQGPAQGRQPGRGRRRRRRAPGRRAQGRGQGHPPARRHAAVARHRDQGRRHDEADRAQHDDPDEEVGDVHDRGGQPAVGRGARAPGRVGDGRRTTRRSASSSSSASRRRRGACRRSRSRSTSTRTGSSTSRRRTRHGQRAADPDPGRLRPLRGRGAGDDPRTRRRTPTRRASYARSSTRRTRRRRSRTRPSARSRSTATSSTSPTPRRSRAGSWSCAQALEGDDVADIRAKTDALQEASHKLAEAVYAQATAQAQASAGGNGATTADDEVVEEGEYEVVDEEAKTS